MEFDFQYLIYKYTLAGAREKFEQICTRLLQRIHGANAHDPRPSQGDDGIDVMVGDFSAPIEVWQCKYFPRELGDAQKNQIREAFRRAQESTKFTMKRWTLCVPIDLSTKEFAWWSDWKKEQEQKTGIPMDLWDGSCLLNLLRDQKLYAEVFGIEGTQQPELLTKWMVDSAKKACTADDVEHYHRVDHRFEVMLRVIAADRDVPHTQAVETVEQALRDRKDVILGGNSGMGKTSLMLRCAVQWVRSGRTALWLNLSERSELTAGEARRMRESLLETLRPEDTALVCIDDPYEGQEALENLRKHFLGEPRIRMMVAERSNRLTQMADRNADCFHNWLEDAVVVTLEGVNAGKPLVLGDRKTSLCVEVQGRRAMILEQCLMELESKGSIPPGSSREIQNEVLEKYDKKYVTLVELIYRALFHARKKASRARGVMLDWDEWERFLQRKMGTAEKADSLYGVIAACSVFGVSMNLDLFAKIFSMNKRTLLRALRILKDSDHVEPVIYRSETETLKPKHGVIAELFFLFHGMTPDESMEEVLEKMNADELEQFLRQVVSYGKKELQSGRRERFRDIDYYALLMLVLDWHEDGDIRLSPEARALALLGLIWCIPKGDRKRGSEVLELLEDAAPDMKEDITFAKLYTEWGKLLADNRKTKAAEKKLLAVIRCNPKDIHSRTELGRLLSKQAGREGAAEQYLKEAIRIDPKNLHPHTELGRLLSNQAGREGEAEQYLKKAIRIDPKNLHPHTELGRLLSKQAGREAEAEQYLKEAMQIDPKHIQSRTELGRLLSNQAGREGEAEEYLKEAIRINSKDIQSRTELGRLMMKQGRPEEAEAYLKEAIRIDPKNLHPHTELGRLLSKQAGREGEAEQYLRDILQIDPKNVQARTELGRLLSKQTGRETEAEEFLKEAIRIDPKNLHSKVVLAGLIWHQRPGEAEQLYREVLRLDMGNQYAKDGLQKMGITP